MFVSPTRNPAPIGDHDGAPVLRHYTYYRPAILVLLKERESHGYELASRMSDLGFDQRLASGIYKVLRDMEDEHLISSSWDMSEHGGPPRRVYALTETGDSYLHDSAPTLVRQRRALDAMLDLYSTLEQNSTPEQNGAASDQVGLATARMDGKTMTATPGLHARPRRQPRSNRAMPASEATAT